MDDSDDNLQEDLKDANRDSNLFLLSTISDDHMLMYPDTVNGAILIKSLLRLLTSPKFIFAKHSLNCIFMSEEISITSTGPAFPNESFTNSITLSRAL